MRTIRESGPGWCRDFTEYDYDAAARREVWAAKRHEAAGRLVTAVTAYRLAVKFYFKAFSLALAPTCHVYQSYIDEYEAKVHELESRIKKEGDEQ